MDSKIKSLLISSIRKIFLYSKLRRDILKLAQNPKRKSIYKCAVCGKYFKIKNVCVDHILPVVNPLEGFPLVKDLDSNKILLNWTRYIYNMFCLPENLQVLCKKKCHKQKTLAERQLGKARKNGKL